MRKTSLLTVTAALAWGGLLMAPAGGEPGLVLQASDEVDPYVGSQMCLSCHTDVEESFSETPHGSEAFQAVAEHNCQACHGPGRAHVQDPTNPETWPKMDLLDLSVQRETCLECHGGGPTHDSMHVDAGISCAGCHTIHQWDAGVTGSAGDGRCLECHTGGAPAHDRGARLGGLSDGAVVQRFHNTPHVLAEVSCVSCHSLETLTTEVRTGSEGAEMCLSCHGEAHPRFRSSPHAVTGCTGCHGVHQAPEPELAATFFRVANISGTSAQCASCHEDIAAAFQYNERHRLQEGIVECVDCHDPHEPSERLRLGGFKHEECMTCHADKGGPFVFEHGAQRVEGCLACHDPHGSPNRRLLHFQRTADLCYSCHVQVPGFHLNFPPDRDCLECHQSIHGSNVDPSFFQ